MRDGLPEKQREALLRLVRAGVAGLEGVDFAGGHVRGVLGRGGLAERRRDGRWYATEMGMCWFGGKASGGAK